MPSKTDHKTFALEFSTTQNGKNTPQTIGLWNYSADVTGNITSSGSSNTTMSYDPFTQLTMRVVKGTDRQNYQYDGSKERVLKIDTNVSSVTKTAYLRGLGDYPIVHKLSTLNERVYIYGLTGLIAVRVDGTWYYIHKDHLGSTRVVSNTNNNGIARYDFDPYGKIDSSSINLDLKYLFTGQEQDETDLWNFRARQFDKEAVIFYAPDPANQGFARYGYCLGNPVSLIDPTGRETEEERKISEVRAYYDNQQQQIFGMQNEMLHSVIFNSITGNKKYVMKNEYQGCWTVNSIKYKSRERVGATFINSTGGEIITTK